MDQQQNLFSDTPKKTPISVNLDEFEISEESFKPVTKGLGFHNDQKRAAAFKPAPKEIKPFASSLPKTNTHALLNEISTTNKTTSSKVVPSGLEAFYGAKPEVVSNLETGPNPLFEKEIAELKKVQLASSTAQLFAWTIDLLLVSSFAFVTTLLLILVSGMSFQSFIRIVPAEDLIVFGSVLFSIYYLLYFTILDLSGTPGKTIFGIRLVRANDKQVEVKHTFTRAFISLLSFVALCLPMIIDFQGRLSDTKVVK